MRTWAIASLVAMTAMGGIWTAAHPTDRPRIGRCHAKVEKPEFHSKGPDSSPHRGGNDQSITSGVSLTCKPADRSPIA